MLAIPTPAGEWSKPLTPVKVTGDHNQDWEAWRKGKAVALPSNSTVTLTIVFAEPVTVRTVEFPSIKSMSRGWCYQPDIAVRFEAGGGR